MVPKWWWSKKRKAAYEAENKRIKAKVKANANAKVKANANAKVKANAIAKVKANAIARANAEQRARAMEMARMNSMANAMSILESQSEANAEAKARNNARAKQEAAAIERARMNSMANAMFDLEAQFEAKAKKLAKLFEEGVVLEKDMHFIILELSGAGMTRCVGKNLCVFKLKAPGSWLFQSKIESKIGTVGQSIFTVRLRDGLFTRGTPRYVEDGPLLGPCDVAVVLRQLSGTCYFNAALNMLCLGQQSASRVLRSVLAQVELLSKDQQDVFYTQPLSLTTCPMNFSWLDVLRVFYAVLVPESPSRWHDDPWNSSYKWNIAAEVIYAVGHRTRTESIDGGNPFKAFTDLCNRLGISWIQDSPDRTQAAEFLIVKYSYLVERVDLSPEKLKSLKPEYAVDSCVILIRYVQGRTTGHHAILGTFCEGHPIIVDSHGYMARCDWLTGDKSELRSKVQLAYDTAMSSPLAKPHDKRNISYSQIDFALFVKQGLMGAIS